MKKYLGVAAGMMGAVALTLAAGPVLARTNVDINIGIPGVIYTQPEPVYVEPRPVYVQPRPVYVQPQPVYVTPQPVYVEQYRGHHGHQWRGRDRDRDGVPDRWDRRPENPYRY
jgi:hypothetical protein